MKKLNMKAVLITLVAIIVVGLVTVLAFKDKIDKFISSNGKIAGPVLIVICIVAGIIIVIMGRKKDTDGEPVESKNKGPLI
jgi:uncharacterized membrane protein YkvI